ncbi:MAG TPA: hypothetical protein VGO58_15955 [Chitinophagaceae bacterium]|jgi:hypothetical protein|nr:hypothetical protein [Chitinophagaceae bacterium]
MKTTFVFFFNLLCTLGLHAQLNHDYDSVTISRFVERNASHGDGWTRITHAGYAADLVNERTIWVKRGKTDSLPYVFSLANRIWENGSKSIGRCFVPRHSINFYRSGMISRYLLVCFQCNGMEFSDLPKENAGLLVSTDVRMRQIDELKVLFKDHL